jgi:hypothetical protein
VNARGVVSSVGGDGMVRDVLCVPQVKKKNMAADYMRVMRSGDYGAWVLDLGRISR